MQPDERDRAYLWDMLSACEEVIEYTAGVTVEAYFANRQLRRSVERPVQIIGEAAAHVSETFKEAHPEIPWPAIIAQRHVLVHGYRGIDHSLIWQVATARIPLLLEHLRNLTPRP